MHMICMRALPHVTRNRRRREQVLYAAPHDARVLAAAGQGALVGWGLGFGVWGFGFWGLGFGVWGGEDLLGLTRTRARLNAGKGLGSKVWGLGFRV
jgi:hypothetical protein